MPCSHPPSPSRFQGEEWIRSDARGHFSLDFVKFQAVPVEAVDASGCAINYQGLDSLCEWAEAGGAVHLPFCGGLQKGPQWPPPLQWP